MHANVMHLPGGWCDQLDACIEHLENIGMGMPLELVRKMGDSCLEGLLDVALSRADCHLAPPTRFLPNQRPVPPAPVLCAFELLLSEAGGERQYSLMAP